MEQKPITDYDTTGEQNEQNNDETPGVEVYDPRPDYKKAGTFGTVRRTTLEALERKDRLGTVDEDDINDITDVLQAVYAVHVDYYMSPRTEIINQIWSVYSGLRDDAKPEYIKDDVLIRRINSVRNYFDKTYRGRLKRWSEMPGTAEAGPAKYPTKKHNRRRDSYHKASEELDERFSKVKSAARGARQRALNAIGSSVAEENEKERKSLRERRRENWEPGETVTFFTGGSYLGEIVRLNKKSVRIRYSSTGEVPEDDPDFEQPQYGSVPERDGEYSKDTIDLDSETMVRRVKDDASDLRRGVRNVDISKEEIDDIDTLRQEAGLPTREESELYEGGAE